MVKVRISFLPSRVFQMYDCYFSNVLTQRSCFDSSSLDSWLAMFHSRRCSYIRTDDPSTKTGVHCELERRGLHSQQFCERCGYFFSPGAPISSFLSQPIFTVIPVTLTFNKTKSALSSIAVVTKAIKRTARTSLSHLGTSTTLFPAIWTRTARSIEELFSQ